MVNFLNILEASCAVSSLESETSNLIDLLKAWLPFNN
tara:strand:- start:447 stop:557 length:111 start_codon:yes stop_codon:yes gene_type:complete